MAKTNSEVINEALRLIGVAPVGQAPDGEEYAVGLTHLNQALEALDEINQAGVAFTADAFPDWAHIPLAKMVAGSVCGVFSLDQYRPLYAEGLRAIKAKAANEARVPGAQVQATYF